MSAAALPIRSEALVLENRPEGGDNIRLRLEVEAWPGAAPGQFAMLSPGAYRGTDCVDPLLPRPMAVYRTTARSAGCAEVEVLYKAMGRGTRLLAAARPGERVRLFGPLGRGFSLPERGVPSLLVGGGTGIASLFELTRLAAERGSVRVLLGARSARDLMGREDFEALGIGLALATEDGGEGHHGRVTELLEAALAEGGEPVVYACGPTPMMRRAAELAAAAGRPCEVSLENHMACGFGVCLGCAVPRAEGGFALVCRDGPVLQAGEVAWEGLP